MHPTRRLLATLAATAAITVLPAGVALATHPHHLDLPNGNCADRGGAGLGTGQVHGDAGAFHDRVHTGTPGTRAFTQERNPVAVVGGSTC